MRQLFTLLLLLCFGVSGYACSCFDAYTPLEEAVCKAEENGGWVFEVSVTATNDNGAFLNIERQLVGTTSHETLFMVNGNGATCGWEASGLSVGTRHLLFAYPDINNSNEVYTYTCGFSNNLYQLNADNSSINYLLRGEEVEGGYFVNAGLEWQAYPYELEEVNCISSTESATNELEQLSIFPNPGNGLINIATQSAGDGALTLKIYNSTGQQIGNWTIGDSSNTLINASDLPIGLYFLVFSNGRNSYTLRYIKH